MTVMLALVLAVGVTAPAAPPADDLRKIVCIAPRDAHGDLMPTKVCKSVGDWKHYVVAETVRQRRKQQLAYYAAIPQVDRGPYVYRVPGFPTMAGSMRSR